MCFKVTLISGQERDDTEEGPLLSKSEIILHQ
jgi:hypothetical protein